MGIASSLRIDQESYFVTEYVRLFTQSYTQVEIFGDGGSSVGGIELSECYDLISQPITPTPELLSQSASQYLGSTETVTEAGSTATCNGVCDACTNDNECVKCGSAY